MNKSWLRLSALIQKETSQLLRDRRNLSYIIGLPLMELFLFAYAVSLTVYHLPTAIADQSQDAQSRAYIQALVDSQYFDFTMKAQDEAGVRRAIDAGDVKAGVVIPPNFSSHLEQGDASVLILLDGSNSFSVQSGYSAASLVSQNYALQVSTQKTDRIGGKAVVIAQAASMPIKNSFQVLYNPDFRDLWFVLPAIVGMLLQTTAVAQAALVVVREREVGTIEQILATPTRPLELLIGKMVPLLVLCFFIVGMILALGIFWFGVAFQGEHRTLFTLVIILYRFQLGTWLFDFNHRSKSTTSTTNQYGVDVVQHVAHRCYLSTQYNAVDSSIDRKLFAAHVLHSHLTRHHHEGRWYLIPLV